ncbi:MAG: 50S ribosomal protein L5 [Calditrichaeota bacterium]|nr:50S ribosomal protein L5 [Calditrichota bacterium]
MATEKKKPEPKAKGGKEGAKKKGEEAAVRGARPPVPEGYEPRLRKEYRERIVPALREKFGYKNVMQVPRLSKIVVNVGAGDASQNPKLLDAVVGDLGIITGQKAAIARAHKSVSNFKLRVGMPIGAYVTLRGMSMFEFLDRLLTVAIPRIRDFRGVSDRSFDGRGNYTLGVREQIVFPEIDYDKIDKIRGMDITIVTTAKTDEEAYELLKEFGMPFRKRGPALEAVASEAVSRAPAAEVNRT